MKALILVDLQNDFCPGGSLAVSEGDKIIPLINRIVERFDLVLATQDWHPENHMSFASNHPGNKIGEVIKLDGLDQVLWPDHCVQHTRGAEFVSALKTKRIHKIFRKGEDARIDSYSGFYDNGHRKSTGLGDYLREKKVETVYICGLATDYCVKYTALDAVKLGFTTHVILDASRGVNLKPGDVEQAAKEMASAGIHLVNSHTL